MASYLGTLSLEEKDETHEVDQSFKFWKSDG